MKRYNYFDDDPQEDIRKKCRFSLPDIDFREIADFIGTAVHYVMSGELAERLHGLPDIKRRLLKLLAFVLFLIFVLLFVLIFMHAINAQNEKNDQFCKDAGTVCTDYMVKLGTVKWESLDAKKYGENTARLTGLCYARQMDFDNDGSDELMICYNEKNVYYLEVWGYHKKKFVKFYSDKANSTKNEKDGAWVGFYHKNSKYYICKSKPDTPEKTELFALRGNKFKRDSDCKYDYKDDIYYIDDKINASDFETIRLSVLRKSKAEVITETVTQNIDSFSIQSLAELESRKTDAQLKAEAYYEIVESRNQKYGRAKIVTEDGASYIDGLALVSLTDFNGDGNEELFLVYRRKMRQSRTNSYSGEFYIVEEPVYCMEVYNWNGTVAKKIFSKNSVSSLMDNTDANFVMLKKNTKNIQICVNTYSYETQYAYTASSRIYRMKGEGFDSVYNARMEYNYGYRDYYIDDEYVYQSQFSRKGYQVPMFLNDEDTSFDASQYQITYLSGKNETQYQNIIDESVKVIQSLDSGYSPTE